MRNDYIPGACLVPANVQQYCLVLLDCSRPLWCFHTPYIWLFSLTQVYGGTESVDKLELLVFAACAVRELLACVASRYDDKFLAGLDQFFYHISASDIPWILDRKRHSNRLKQDRVRTPRTYQTARTSMVISSANPVQVFYLHQCIWTHDAKCLKKALRKICLLGSTCYHVLWGNTQGTGY